MDYNFSPGSISQPQIHFELSSDCFFGTTSDNSIDQLSLFEKLSYPITDQFEKDKLPNLGNSIWEYQPISDGPAFPERAENISCWDSRNFDEKTGNNSNGELGDYESSVLVGNVNLNRVLSSHFLNVGGSQMRFQDKKNLGKKQVKIRTKLESPVSDRILSSTFKKRKTASKRNSMEIMVAEEIENSKAKLAKDNEGSESENGSGNINQVKSKQTKPNTKPPEPLKDYIHVRARRGQATDSHSLAERVRREKIGERMKFLQDLVPGCKKVTGKALVLDEIINYVQTLQRQVEILSMKLATVDPSLDFNTESIVRKDVIQPYGSIGNQIDTSATALFGHQNLKLTQIHNNISNGETTVDPLDTHFRHNIGLQSSPLFDFGHGLSQFQTLCEDDLQSIVQMGLGRGLNSQGLPHS